MKNVKIMLEVINKEGMKVYTFNSTKEIARDLFDGFLGDYDKNVADYFGVEYEEGDHLCSNLEDIIYGDDL